LSSLLLAVPYCVATALLTGDLTVADFAAPALHDERRWRLAEKVTLRHDPEMTRALLDSTAPFGAALREADPAAAKRWLEQLGGSALADLFDPGPGPAGSFADATKRTPARVTVHLRDGRTASAEQDIPIGGAGPDTRAGHARLVREKFRGCGGSAADADAWLGLETIAAPALTRLLDASLS
jgi:2-methylcitrate dehydratase PrpD